MNNKTKKEIWDELQMYKKQAKQYKDFWEINTDEHNKTSRHILIILLMILSFLLGLIL